MEKWDKEERRLIKVNDAFRYGGPKYSWAVQYFVSGTLAMARQKGTIIQTDDKHVIVASKEFEAAGIWFQNKSDILVNVCKICEKKFDKYDMLIHVMHHLNVLYEKHDMIFATKELISDAEDLVTSAKYPQSRICDEMLNMILAGKFDTAHLWAARYYAMSMLSVSKRLDTHFHQISNDKMFKKNVGKLYKDTKYTVSKMCSHVDTRQILVNTCKVCGDKIDGNEMIIHVAEHIQASCGHVDHTILDAVRTLVAVGGNLDFKSDHVENGETIH